MRRPPQIARKGSFARIRNAEIPGGSLRFPGGPFFVRAFGWVQFYLYIILLREEFVKGR